jgi:hypothetical protein
VKKIHSTGCSGLDILSTAQRSADWDAAMLDHGFVVVCSAREGNPHAEPPVLMFIIF